MEIQPVVKPIRPLYAPPKEDYTRLRHAEPNHRDYVAVNWCLGNLCNYTCSYCPKGLHDGSANWVTLDDAVRFVDFVIQHYGEEKKYFFEFTGGEVSLFKGLPRLVTHLKERGAKVGLISNGSRSLEFWKKIESHLDQICLSFHPESANPDHYLEVVRQLSQTVRTHVNIMMSPAHFEVCCRVAEKAVQIPNLSLALQPLLEDLAGEMYTYPPDQKKVIDSQYELFTKHIKFNRNFEYFRGAMMCETEDGKQVVASPHKFISSGTNQWQGWDCYAGVEQFVVDMKGKILRGWCGVGGTVGYIHDENLKLPTLPVRCNKSACHCNFDIMCSKVRA